MRWLIGCMLAASMRIDTGLLVLFWHQSCANWPRVAERYQGSMIACAIRLQMAPLLSGAVGARPTYTAARPLLREYMDPSGSGPQSMPLGSPRPGVSFKCRLFRLKGACLDQRCPGW